MTDAIGTVTMYPKLERREWIFGTAPDPRDARIAELEAALREIHKITGSYTGHGESARVFAAWRIADAAIMQAPERDMVASVEELDA